MAHAIFIAPAGAKVGLTSSCLGLVRMLDCLRVRVGYFKPVEQIYDWDQSPDKSLDLISKTSDITPLAPISAKDAKQYLSKGQDQELLEKVVGLYQKIEKDFDIIVVEGLYTNKKMPFSARLNLEISRSIDAEIIFVASMADLNFTELNSLIELSTKAYGGIENPKVLGCIVNHANAPRKTASYVSSKLMYQGLQQPVSKTMLQEKCNVFSTDAFKLLGLIPWNASLSAPRTCDVARFLSASDLHPGDMKDRRVLEVVTGAAALVHICGKLNPHSLLLVAGDREDIILAGCMAALNGIPLAGIVLTDGLLPRAEVLQFCERAMLTGLPIVTMHASLYQTALMLENMNNEIPTDDIERIEVTVSYLADCIEANWIKEHCAVNRESYFSPPAFRYSLINKAKEAKKTIVLPEGEEPRMIQAAIICHQKEIARCILIGEEGKIHQQAETNKLLLPKDIQIIRPEDVKDRYVDSLVELRKHKSITREMAARDLDDHITLGTMMLALEEVDGLVAGTITTTANTIRPALRFIKTKPECKIVSSIFFMCLPEQVVVYGDCAVNPNPNAEELADIAIQSADSAKAFGITPRVAMISYSTGTSGSGGDVEKVAQATKLAQEKRPDLLIDGPLQYDAAAIESVGRKKAPNSEVAGRATVFVFPDLNTGNTTYKAVQRSANVVSIGPMLQGLRKPVNDLSRGALVDDIVYTIALTCIQANNL